MSDSPMTRAPGLARMARVPALARVAGVAAVAARLTLGVLWVLEGITKYRAHFGAADIGFLVSGSETNERIPGYFEWLAHAVMSPLRVPLGFAMPAVEVALGLALILGVLPLAAALASIALLATYWSGDLLIAQYPVMLLLSAGMVMAPKVSGRWGITSLWRRRRA
ncbi:hypothetical protein ACSDQ9_09230 [Aestuariimicrobium soli]|uniref:hypothetical protein n=1 Tax=Aestuariimicrobium soli TaxID=2035834 RepID=UPI003EBC7105